jgi:hypothetical protein
LAFYSGGAEFIFRTGNLPSCGFFIVSSVPPGECSDILIRPRPLPPKSFPIYNSPVILSFDVMQFIATIYGLDSRGSIPGSVETGSGAHPASYPLSNFGEAAGA